MIAADGDSFQWAYGPKESSPNVACNIKQIHVN